MTRSFRRQAFTVIHLLVVIAIVLFLGAIVFSWVMSERRINSRVECAKHLRQIGNALIMYTNDNKGLYPSTGFNYTESRALKLDETGRALADGSLVVGGVPQAGWNNVPASWFLLAKLNGMTMDLFTCPGSYESRDPLQGDPAAPKNVGNVAQHANFTSLQQNLSYGFAPPYTNAAGRELGYRLTNALTADFAIAADRYQGSTAGGAPSTDVNDTPANQQKMNSANHQHDGQNVLYADAHVSFEKSCFAGWNKNNIYFADHGTGGPKPGEHIKHDTRVYTNGGAGVTASVQIPTNEEDSVLVPWAADNQ